ncbi:MAG: metallophosphoesterase [Fimbriimonadaceae bacterium]
MGKLRILQTNDFHGKLTPSRLPFLLKNRETADLYFDCGDCIKAGNLAIPVKADTVWPMLAEANITASVPGNRESHILESVVKAKFAGATHPILCANWFCNDGTLRFQDHLILTQNGLKIGVFGVMVAMVTDRMATRKASQFVWANPITTAQHKAQELRPQVDLLIALTHIGYTEDQKLAEVCPEIDIILGGHSHTVLESPRKINQTVMCQTGSHGRYLGVYDWDGELTKAELIPWEEI